MEVIFHWPPCISNLNHHVQTVHKEKNYMCQDCDKIFSTKGNLKSHIESVHEGKKFACFQCNHEFALKSSLSKHEKRKHKKNEYQDPLLNFESGTNMYLGGRVKTEVH